MKNILFVGEHPRGVTGNASMMAALLSQLDRERFHPICFTSSSPRIRADIFSQNDNVEVLVANETRDLGNQDLLRLIQYNIDNLDAVVMAGIDVWKYAGILDHLVTLGKSHRLKTAAILPYDLPTVREDWANWFSAFDIPCVYSKFGHSLLESSVKKIRYFRPPHHNTELFYPYDEEQRKEARNKYFSQLGEDRFIFGFIGANQFRKDPQRAIKAFFEVKERHPNISLYLHTNIQEGVFNLEQIAVDYAATYGAKIGDVISKPKNFYYDREAMVAIYNSIDCLVNTSTHEGLSWTLLEAMLCGTPVIASDNTAQSELLEGGAGHGVPCNEMGYIPVITISGESFVETTLCDFRSLVEAMDKVVKYKKYREKLVKKGLERAKEWVEGVDNINDLLDELVRPKAIVAVEDKKKGILFVQHSSGGDVLMSTQCFKGLKERHAGLPLIYMTNREYQGIVHGNPHVDQIVDYDETVIKDYDVVYNPHGEKILPGGFNNLDVRLHDMYPYFCDVKPDKMFISPDKPDINLPDNYIVIQTAGGEKTYRTYRHLPLVIKMMSDLKFVQLGGGGDMACSGVHMDLREKLTWRQSAWVMKNARAAVVIDSFLSHLAGALATPAVVLYGPAPARVTGPKGNSEIIVNLEPNKLDVCPIMSNCWGQPGKVPCTSPCINTINPMEVVRSLGQLLKPFGE